MPFGLRTREATTLLGKSFVVVYAISTEIPF
jgi:hypothetical protein